MSRVDHERKVLLGTASVAVPPVHEVAGTPETPPSDAARREMWSIERIVVLGIVFVPLG
jgi:hypothetical protein